MEMYFLNDNYNLLYNCSFYSVEQVPFYKRRQILIGIFFIILFFVFEILYIPSLFILFKKQFYQQSCYKLMFFMGISDLICMFINGFFTGIFAIFGVVFCTFPSLIYFLGILAISLWAVQSDIGMILALNRCLEMYDPRLNAYLFKGQKTYYWILASIVHAFIFAVFTKPVCYSSIYVSWFFNPHIGYFEDYGKRYNNILHTLHNLIVVIVMSLCYIAFIVLLCRKSRHINTTSRNFTRNQKESYLQVFVICFFVETAAVIYVFMQFFPVASIIILIGQLSWFLAHGSPAVIYLMINKTIQKKLMQFLRKKANHTVVNVGIVQNVSSSLKDERLPATVST